MSRRWKAAASSPPCARASKATWASALPARWRAVWSRSEAGQVLATLDQVDLGLQLDQAQAELRAAKGSQMQAEAELKRNKTLRKSGWTTDADLEKQRA